MIQISDHPDIQKAEREGVPVGQPPYCPICGQECEFIYRSVRTLEIFGCDVCVETKDAWEETECYPGEE